MEPPPPGAWLQGQVGGFAHQALELAQDVTRAGSGAGCEVCLREPNAVEVHTVVRYARGQYYMQDKGVLCGVAATMRQIGFALWWLPMAARR